MCFVTHGPCLRFLVAYVTYLLFQREHLLAGCYGNIATRKQHLFACEESFVIVKFHLFNGCRWLRVNTSKMPKKSLRCLVEIKINSVRCVYTSSWYRAFSPPGQFAPRSELANRTRANSLPGPFAPWPFRSLAISFPGTFAARIRSYIFSQ